MHSIKYLVYVRGIWAYINQLRGGLCFILSCIKIHNIYGFLEISKNMNHSDRKL